jgi:hypothetical protein
MSQAARGAQERSGIAPAAAMLASPGWILFRAVTARGTLPEFSLTPDVEIAAMISSQEHERPNTGRATND